MQARLRKETLLCVKYGVLASKERSVVGFEDGMTGRELAGVGLFGVAGVTRSEAAAAVRVA
jgi:hypothetical protein